MKHVTARFAWHDSKWNGRICSKPKENTDCRDNFSLLSPRIQRRINVDLEDQFAGKTVAEIFRKTGYLPPCYWSINALGNLDYTKLQDRHPFDATAEWGSDFKERVKPLDVDLSNHSIFTWCFHLGYPSDDDETEENYVPESELRKRVKAYCHELRPGKSIVFFYANYSNPFTDDDHKYLLLGAGLLDSSESNYEYSIPKDILADVRGRHAMKNFPEKAWQMQLHMRPESQVLLPYQEFLEWSDAYVGMDREKKLKALDDVSVPIEENNIIPNFKYVSMHVNQHVCIIRLDQHLALPEYIAFYLSLPQTQKQIWTIQSGASRQGLNFSQVRSLDIFLPDLKYQARVVRMVRCYQMLRDLQRESYSNLQMLFASISTRLFNGQLKIVTKL